MNSISRRGDVVHGVGGGQVSVNNVPFSRGAALGWIDDDTVAFVDGENDGWLVSSYHIPTRQRSLIDFNGAPRALRPPVNRPFTRSLARTQRTPHTVATAANQGYADGGVVAVMLNSRDDTRGIYSTNGLRLLEAGLTGVGRQGAIIYKPSYQSHGPTMVHEPTGAEWKLTDGHAVQVSSFDVGVAVHEEADLRNVIGHNMPNPVVANDGGIWFYQAAFCAGRYWSGYYSGSHGIVMHPFDSLQGISILPKGDGWPLFRELPGTNIIRVWISTTEGAQPGHMWCRDYDVVANLVRDPLGANVWQPVPLVDVSRVNVDGKPCGVKYPPNDRAGECKLCGFAKNLHGVEKPPVCDRTYRKGDDGICEVCLNLKAAHKLTEGNMGRYRDPREILDYYQARWSDLGIESKTDAIRQATGIVDDKAMEQVSKSDPARAAAAENQFKNLQIPAFIQIVGEMYHTKGWRDVGLGRKTGGNRWETPNGSVATDILILKDLDGGPELHMFDAMSSGGGPEARPALNQDEWNPERTFVEPPQPTGGGGGTGDTHKYDGGGNDTGICDRCGQPADSPVHNIPGWNLPHAFDPGEGKAGRCYICRRGKTDPLHAGGQVDPPPPSGELAARVTAVETSLRSVAAKGEETARRHEELARAVQELQSGGGGQVDQGQFLAWLKEVLGSRLAVQAEVKPNGSGILRHGHGISITILFDGTEVAKKTIRAEGWQGSSNAEPRHMAQPAPEVAEADDDDAAQQAAVDAEE